MKNKPKHRCDAVAGIAAPRARVAPLASPRLTGSPDPTCKKHRWRSPIRSKSLRIREGVTEEEDTGVGPAGVPEGGARHRLTGKTPARSVLGARELPAASREAGGPPPPPLGRRRRPYFSRYLLPGRRSYRTRREAPANVSGVQRLGFRILALLEMSLGEC